MNPDIRKNIESFVDDNQEIEYFRQLNEDVNHDFITIIDIKKFLNIPKTDITEKTKIIVIRTENMQIGILVDDVFGIENIPAEKLSHNMQTKYEKNNFTAAEIMLNNRVMCVFDLKKFLEDERLFIEDAV